MANWLQTPLYPIYCNAHPQIEVLLTHFLNYDPEIRMIEKDERNIFIDPAV